MAGSLYSVIMATRSSSRVPPISPDLKNFVFLSAAEPRCERRCFLFFLLFLLSSVVQSVVCSVVLAVVLGVVLGALLGACISLIVTICICVVGCGACCGAYLVVGCGAVCVVIRPSRSNSFRACLTASTVMPHSHARLRSDWLYVYVEVSSLQAQCKYNSRAFTFRYDGHLLISAMTMYLSMAPSI